MGKALEEEENAKKAASAVQEDVEYEQFEKEENKKTEDPVEQPKLSEQEKMAMIEEQIKLMEVDHETVLETEVAESNDELKASLIPTVSDVVLEDINFTAPAGKIKRRGKAWKNVERVGVRKVSRAVGRETP